MKRRDLLSALIDMVLATVITIAGVGCLTSGLHLWTDMTAVALTALGFALLGVLCCRLPKGWIVLLLTFVLGVQLLWDLQFLENFYPQLKQALSYYHVAYGWGVPEWLADYEPYDATLTACVIAAGVALLAGISLSKNWYIGALLAQILPVIPCILVTNTVPETLYVWLGLVAMAVVTLTWSSRRMNSRQANRLTAMVLIPVVLASTLLFARNPQSEYEAPGRDEGIFLLMQKLAEHIPFMNMKPDGAGNGGGGTGLAILSPDTVDLTNAGPRDPRPNMTAMEVFSYRSGVLYLRGRSYNTYTGLSWQASSETETLLRPDVAYLTDEAFALKVSTPFAFNVQHIPYFVGAPVELQQGMLPNEESLQVFHYSVQPLRSHWKLIWRQEYATMTRKDMMNFVAEQSLTAYLALPESTAWNAGYHLKQAGVTGYDEFVHSTVEKIRNYVRNSADYYVSTGYMPDQTGDFAMWFLEVSDTGYCVHFATAATVLLRAAGIPARYVEGYLMKAEAGQTIAVTNANAHAWVEYYLPDVGWVVLEATPDDGLPVTLPPEPTMPPETQPTEPETTVPTEPTEPTEPSEPTEPTPPTRPTKPTEPTESTEPETSTVPTAPTQPTEPVEQPEPPQPQDWSGLKQALRWIVLGLAGLLVVIGQWRLRLSLRRRRMRGNSWAQVRVRWRYACLLAKLCGHRPPPVLEALAKRAKFSQHTLNRRQLRQFDRYGAACIRALRKHPWPLRLVYRLVLAAW